MNDACVLLIGGRSGVGKSSAGSAVHDLLAERRLRHAVIEGDTLDLAWPVPWEHGDDMSGRNLAAIWRNYRAAGYRRLVYTNTSSVLEVRHVADVMGEDPRTVAVLLRASDDTARARLSQRETGASLERHVERSRLAAGHLDERCGDDVHRLDTDALTPGQVAEILVQLAGWT